MKLLGSIVWLVCAAVVGLWEVVGGRVFWIFVACLSERSCRAKCETRRNSSIEIESPPEKAAAGMRAPFAFDSPSTKDSPRTIPRWVVIVLL